MTRRSKRELERAVEELEDDDDGALVTFLQAVEDDVAAAVQAWMHLRGSLEGCVFVGSQELSAFRRSLTSAAENLQEDRDGVVDVETVIECLAMLWRGDIKPEGESIAEHFGGAVTREELNQILRETIRSES